MENNQMYVRVVDLNQKNLEIQADFILDERKRAR